MKIRIEQNTDVAEDEIVIRCARVDSCIKNIHQYILEQLSGAAQVAFYKGDTEYYFPVSEVLFFETEGDAVYAHTPDDSFRTKSRLYELEQVLPRAFVRVSKSSILNTARVRAVTRNLTSASLVEFSGTSKHVYASRRYYSELKQRLSERST